MDEMDLEAELGLTSSEPAPTPAPKPVLEGVIVKSPTAAAAKPAPAKPPKHRIRALASPAVKRREKTFTDVTVSQNKEFKFGRFSDRERKMLTVLLKTGNVAKAAEEIGVTVQTVYNYIKKPFVKAYLAQMRERSALAADLSMDKVAGVINRGINGEELTDTQLKSAAIAAKFLSPAKSGPSITVNTQNNFNGTSPFQSLDQSGMLDEIKRNLLEMQDPDA